MQSYRGWLAGLCFVGLALGQYGAEGAGVEGLYEVNGDGTFTYRYTVDNTDGSFVIFGWSLGLASFDWDPLDVSFGGDVEVPDGWVALPGVPVGTAVAQDFLSLDPATDVLVGAMLGGFSFTSSLGPGPVPYLAFGETDVLTGNVVGPVGIIPEGGTSLAFLGLSGIAFAAWLSGRLRAMSGRGSDLRIGRSDGRSD